MVVRGLVVLLSLSVQDVFKVRAPACRKVVNIYRITDNSIQEFETVDIQLDSREREILHYPYFLDRSQRVHLQEGG